MGLRRIWTISHGRLDHSRHCRRGRGPLAPKIRFLTIAQLGKTETAPLPAPFLVHLAWIGPLRLALAGATRSGTPGVGDLLAIQK